MVSTISRYTRNVCAESYQNMPSANQMLKNLTKMAIPAIALAGFCAMQTAEGGPVLYSVCLAACVPLIEAPPLAAICVAACLPVLALPGF